MTHETLPTGRGLSHASIVAVAAALFARKSYRATTLDDIAAELGVKKASLYHYIPSKEHILCDIYQQIFDRIETAVAPHVSLDLPPDERLRRMIHAHITVVANEQASLSVVFQEEAELPAELQPQIRHRKRAHEALFEQVIADGQNEGVFRAGSVRLMVLGLLGMCNWMHKWYHPERFTIDDVAAEFSLTLESGLRSGSSRAGAWPRFGSLEEAFEPSERALGRARAELEALERELAATRERLQDGLARPHLHSVGGGESAEQQRGPVSGTSEVESHD